MPTRTSRGRYNSARPAAPKRGRPVVVVPPVPVPSVIAPGAGDEVTKVGTAVVVGTGTGFIVVCVDGGSELKVGDGGGRVGGGSVGGGGAGSVFVGGGTLIVVGPPTGPVQISPLGQHPMIPLLARAQ